MAVQGSYRTAYEDTAPVGSGVSDADILAYVQANINNPAAIAAAAQQFNVSAADLARATNYSEDAVNSYFTQAKVTPYWNTGIATIPPTVVDTKTVDTTDTTGGITTLVSPVTTVTSPVVTVASPVVTTSSPVVTVTSPVVTVASPITTVTSPIVTVTTPSPIVTVTSPVVTVASPVTTVTSPIVTVTTPTPVVTVATPVVTVTSPTVTVASPIVTVTSPVVTATSPTVTEEDTASISRTIIDQINAAWTKGDYAATAGIIAAAGLTPAQIKAYYNLDDATMDFVMSRGVFGPKVTPVVTPVVTPLVTPVVTPIVSTSPTVLVSVTPTVLTTPTVKTSPTVVSIDTLAVEGSGGNLLNIPGYGELSTSTLNSWEPWRLTMHGISKNADGTFS